MRQIFSLSLLLLLGSSLACAQGSFDGCDPDVLLAVDDNYIIQEEDLSSFTANLLSNDIIGIDAFVSIEGLPPCFQAEQGTGFIFYTGSADGSSCCGTFNFVYTLLTGTDLFCTAEVTITVECGTDKGDCSVIVLEPGMMTDPDVNGDGTTVDDSTAACVYVCENSITKNSVPIAIKIEGMPLTEPAFATSTSDSLILWQRRTTVSTHNIITWKAHQAQVSTENIF